MRTADHDDSNVPGPRVIVRVTIPEEFTGACLGKLQRHHAVLQSIDRTENGTFCITADVPEMKLKVISWAIVNITDNRGKLVRVS